jgi:uncharacterized protein (UPF0335 family)
MPSKEQYETLFNRVIGYEESKATITADIKDAFESFAAQNEVNQKGVIKAYKAYKEILKDREKFVAIEAGYDAATNALLETV